MPVSRRVIQEDKDNDDAQDCLRPYTFHDVDLSVRAGQATGNCPFCYRDGKFSVEVDTGLWRCWVCAGGESGGGGNALTFTRLIYERAAEAARAGRVRTVVAEIAADRKLLSEDTVAAWGVVPGGDGTWLVPGYGADGRLDQVYRRTRVKEGGAWVWRLLPTPGVWPPGRVHALHLPAADFDPARACVDVFEGPWDGAAAWEVSGGKVLADTNVIAVPGCNVWRDEWTALCRGKRVRLWYDSDHPKMGCRTCSKSYSTVQHVDCPLHRTPLEGPEVAPAGRDGMRRIASRLSGVAAAVQVLRWGPEWYDPERASGWDVRDALAEAGDTLAARRRGLAALLGRVEDAPAEWFTTATGPSLNGTAHGAGSVESRPCHTWAACEAAWREAMRWRQDMSDALAVILAVCASTQQGGNQLFIQLVGSAGSGKTTMCDGILVSHHCHHLEHLTGFHSGYKLPEDGKKDCSLIARINGKTLVTPEADVLMSSPRFQEIMSQQRRIFDGKSGATYKNSDQDTLYSGLRTPWIMAGTHAMMDHDQSHLGDRFLRFIIGDPQEDEKRAILRKALHSERVAMLERANGTAGSVVDPKTRHAHGLTGGYVDWLRANVEEKLALVDVSGSAEDHCIDLAELSADLRARPSNDAKQRVVMEAHDSKELPTRLARQNIRLASCLAVVLNKRSVDAEVLRIVRKVALDTAAGHSLSVVQWLCSENPRAIGQSYQESGGLMEDTLQVWLAMTPERAKKYLMFLQKIGVVEWRSIKQSHGAWVLTERAYDLYLRIMTGVT